MRHYLAAVTLFLLAACSQERATNEATAPQATASASPTGQTAAQTAYRAANERMHAGMVTVDPDPDVAFMQGMLAHHRGAVAMSEVALTHALDSEVRALAAAVIAAQEKEIAQMEGWLAKRGQSAPAAVTTSGTADPHAAH